MISEKNTVEIMVKMYCDAHHSANGKPCENCKELLEYVNLRLEKCPLKENKPTCAKCTIHCYKPEMRTKIISVMRYSGPMMLLKHPVLALFHK